MQAIHLFQENERKSALRQVICHRAPGIKQEHLDLICESVNTKRRYFVKVTNNREKFMNLVTRETIITDEIRAFSEVIPLYGSFQSPYFEKNGENRISLTGTMEPAIPAAAVKIRVATEAQRTSVTYSLIIYMADRTILRSV